MCGDIPCPLLEPARATGAALTTTVEERKAAVAKNCVNANFMMDVNVKGREKTIKIREGMSGVVQRV